MKLLGYRRIAGRIVLRTGLHIGGSDPAVEIGGMDNPIIKEPITDQPYIPGSSLKGKMRSLLELREGKIDDRGGPYQNAQDDHFIVRIFGISAGRDNTLGPGRLIVRDARLTAEGLQYLKEWKKRVGSYTEEKAENTINRITGMANPRTMERVPAGAEFELDLVYRIFDVDGDGGQTDMHNFQYVLQDLKLIEMDALGGSGSRGYGRVEFVDLVDEAGNPVPLPTEEEVCAATV